MGLHSVTQKTVHSLVISSLLWRIPFKSKALKSKKAELYLAYENLNFFFNLYMGFHLLARKIQAVFDTPFI